jgi:plastocyanin
MRVVACVIAALLTVGALAGCGDDDSDSSGVDLSDKEFVDETGNDAVTVDALDNNFRPQYVEVSAGTTVTFENRGRNVHNVIPAEEGAFETIDAGEFEPEDTGDIVFDEPGDYPYYCSLHGNASAGMIGGLRVVE